MRKLKFIFLLLLIAGLTSCGLFKKVTTAHSSDKVKSKTDSTYSTTVTDHSTITTTDRIDTIAKTPETHIIADKPVSVDSTGIISAELDSLMFKIKVSFNSLTKSVSFDILKRSESVPVKLDRTTTEHRDIVTDSKGRVKSAVKKKADDKGKVSDPKTELMVILIGSFCLVILIVGLFLYYKAKTASNVIKTVI